MRRLAKASQRPNALAFVSSEANESLGEGGPGHLPPLRAVSNRRLTKP